MIDVVIRLAVPEDDHVIDRIHTQAFGGPAEAQLVTQLRDQGYTRVSLVAENEEGLVGHILFSELCIETPTQSLPALALAPMAVLPRHQRQGIGSRLVQDGLQCAREDGHQIVIVLGHPNFYPRFGFSAGLAEALDAPFSGDAFMALELIPGALKNVEGTVVYPPPFSVA